MLGHLDGERSHPAGRPEDQDPLPGLDLAHVADRLEGGQAGDGDGRRLLDGDGGGLGGEVVLGRARVLGVGAAVGPAKDLVASAEPGDLWANGFDPPGQVHAPDRDLGWRSPRLGTTKRMR